MQSETIKIKLSEIESIKAAAKKEIDDILLKYSSTIPGYNENHIGLAMTGIVTCIYDQGKYLIEDDNEPRSPLG